MGILGSLLGNDLSDTPDTTANVASQYFTDRYNQDLSNVTNSQVGDQTPQQSTITPAQATLSSGGGYNAGTAGAGGISALGGAGQGFQVPQMAAGQQPSFNFGGGDQTQNQPSQAQAPQASQMGPTNAAAQGQAPGNPLNQPQGIAQAPQAPQAPQGMAQAAPAAPAQTGAVAPGMGGAQGIQATPQQVQQFGYPTPVQNAPGIYPSANQVTSAQDQAAQAQNAAPQWSQQLQQNSNNFNGLAGMIADGKTPDDVRDEAKSRMIDLLKDEQAKRIAGKTLDGAVSGDRKSVNDLAREMSTDNASGSYLKAIFFHRMGLNQLAQDEEQKLGAGSKYTSYMDANGNHFTVKQGANGAVQRAFDQNGTAVDNDTLANLNANYMSMKGAQTGQTMGFDKNGNTISHTVVPGTGRVIWKNETSGQILPGAPEGYHQGKNQQEMLANNGYAQSRRADETKNRNEVAAGRSPIYSEDEIEQRASDTRNRIMGLPTTTYGNTGGAPAAGGTPPTIPGNAGAATGGAAPAGTQSAPGAIGSDLSPALQSKIVSGNRSPEQQQALYQETIDAGREGIGPTGLPVAKPGTSAHETGNAMDLPKNLSRDERQELAQKGYFQPMGADSVHWERANPVAKSAPVGAGNPTVRDIQQANAQAIANYEQPPVKGSGMNGQNATIMSLVRQINPNYDASKYDTMAKARTAFTTGKQGDTVRSMNVAIDHLDTFQDAANALGNGNNRVFNAIGNEYARQTGQTAPTNFDSLKTIVGSEVAKAIQGGASALGDREEIRNEISSASSPQQLAGVIGKYQKLLGGQLNGLRTQAQDAGLKDFDNKLNPRTKKVLSGGQNNNTRSNW